MNLIEQATQPSNTQYPTCHFCGKPVKVFRKCRVRKFCDRTCAAKSTRPPNPEPTKTEMREGIRRISLTRGQYAIVDASDYECLIQWVWCAQWMPNSQSFYVVRSTPRDPVTRKQGRITMARVIMNAPEGMLVDHHDHDTLNNRKGNLRVCTYPQNGSNARMLKPNIARVRGIHWVKADGSWRAEIKVNGKPIGLGQFRDKEMAVEAYQQAAIKYKGEFAHVARYEGP